MKNKLNNLTNKEWLKFQKSWFIHNPPPRKKGVLVHPAKYPETMAQEFIEFFTREGETVLDPMAGTGSTLVAALRAGRNSYGIELNPKYAKIAKQIIEEERKTLGEKVEGLTSKVVNGDAAKVADFGLSTCDYVLTSPPYWDMLRARGAETQKKRRSAEELDVHYSDDPNDMGNISDYDEFLAKLVRIYAGLKPLLREKAYLTIIVKNVKKGGKIYPLAWDIARELGKTYTLKDEKIWCLPPGQRVWTQSGLKPIENIATNEKVLTHLGTLENVTKTMQHHHSGQLITIKAALLGKAISMTAEHEVLTIERKRYRHRNGELFQENFQRSEQRGSLWKPAKDLKIGDVVAFPIPQTTIDLVQLDTSFYLPEVVDWIQDDNWYYTRGRGKQGRGKLPKFISINNDFMRLAGWYLSEGSASVSGAHIANRSPKAQHEIVKLFQSVFDISLKADVKGVWCRSRSISNLLENIFGRGAHQKKIPDFMFHLPKEKQRHLLQSLWAGDGHVHEKRVLYKTVSESLATGISYLTARLGAMPYIQRNPKWFNLSYRGQSMIKMQELLGSATLHRIGIRDQHWVRDSLIWLPIRQIEAVEYSGPVYNLEVETANSYATENFIVHNCQDNQPLAPYGMGSAWVSNTFHHYCLQFRNE
jgi:DNA modification methylase/intein/homing endonuclease